MNRPPRPRWTRRDFGRPPEELARALLGQRLVRVTENGTRLSGLIVETEAYLGVHDRAAHSFGGRRTRRNEAMYARPGTAYVYFTYGMHHCFNVVCGAEGEPVAVLIRALEPVEGVGPMRRRRAASMKRPGPLAPFPSDLLCSGPARLCQALALDRRHDAIDLATSGAVFIEREPSLPECLRVNRAPRIGIASSGEWARAPLRWFIQGNPHVSRS